MALQTAGDRPVTVGFGTAAVATDVASAIAATNATANFDISLPRPAETGH